MAHEFGEFGSSALGTAQIRPMQPADLPSVRSIERRSYAFPWSEQIFVDCIRAGYVCRVLEREGIVRGYGIMSTGGGESHMLNLCVDPGYRREGFARMLLGQLIEHARAAGAESMYLEVRPSNVAAIHLYHSMGFNEIHIRPDYYPAENGREDALVLGRDLTFFV